MGQICLVARSHRDAWPTTYAGQRHIRPTIERPPSTTPSHGHAPRQRCASEGSSSPTATAGSEGSTIAAASSASSGISASTQQPVRAGAELGDVSSVSPKRAKEATAARWLAHTLGRGSGAILL
jgi:hypothetical protein